MKNTNSNDLWTASYDEIGATLKILQDQGITTKHLAQLRTEPDYAKRVAEFMRRDSLENSAHHNLARYIMGKNFFGVEEWSAFYSINFSKKELQEVSEFPWNENVLNSLCPFVKNKNVRETHFAFLGLDAIKDRPLPILNWQKIHPASSQPCFWSYSPKAWYSGEEFAKEPTCSFRWYLMPLEVIPSSIEKTYQEQTEILPADYETAFAIEEVTKNILYYRKNGIYLNPSSWSRCQDVSSDKRRVIVGYFDAYGLDINDYYEGNRDYGIGLAASRKL